MSKDLISREAAKNALAGRFDAPTYNEIVCILKQLSSDTQSIDSAEVVRCEKCVNYNDHRYCNYSAMPVLDNDFCSYGERREND